MSNGTPYFPIWFSELDQAQGYEGNHDKQVRIPDQPVAALSQGELASPNVLSKRIDEVKNLKTKVEWAVLVAITFLVALTVKVWTDSSKLKEAVEFGYKKKADEILSDSTFKKMQSDYSLINRKVDSLVIIINKKSNGHGQKHESK